jgi:hypothetical protein
MICEVFVVFYANIPSHKAHFAYRYAGLHGKAWPGAVDVVVSAVMVGAAPVYGHNW